MDRHTDRGPTALSLSILNRIDDLAANMDRAEAFLHAGGVDPGDTVQIMIMLDELGSNIIKSAWADDGEHRFSIELRVENGALLALTTIDDGVPFDPTHMEPPDLDADLDDRAVGGLGLFMVGEMSDAMEYSRVDGQNRLLVTKRLQAGLSGDRS